MTNRCMRRPLRLWIFALGTVVSTATFAQQSSQALNTRALAATCANCHGTDGYSVEGQAMVKLAGLNQSVIAAQLRAFRDGQRPATVMHQLTKGYSDQQIDAIAAYFASLK